MLFLITRTPHFQYLLQKANILIKNLFNVFLNSLKSGNLRKDFNKNIKILIISKLFSYFSKYRLLLYIKYQSLYTIILNLN